MMIPKVIKIKLEKVGKNEFPVLKSVSDKYIIFDREYMCVE